MSDRISVDRKEFQAFVAENQELVKRCQELHDKLNSLREVNKDLQRKLDLAERKLNFLEKKVGVGVQVGDDTPRKARAVMNVASRSSPRRGRNPIRRPVQ
jgi:predicted  nucleic acid-binding Zn-ribbon protein